MMKAFCLLPLVAAYQVMDTQNHVDVHQNPSDSFDGMKAMFKEISAKQKRGEKINNDTVTSVQSAIDSIEKQLVTALKEDVERTQAMLDDELAEVKACNTAKSNWAANAETGHIFDNTTQNSKQKAHEDCRAAEDTLCDTATTKCDELEKQVCGWEGQCPKPNDWTKGDTDEVYKYMTCLEKFFKKENQTYFSHKTTCLNAVTAWHRKSDSCDTAQDSFERAFCEKERNVESKCKTHRDCRNTANADYDTVRERVKELEDVYQTQAVALDSLKCFGDKILKNDTDISSCETPKKCCTLDYCPTIVYKAVPACLACSEPDPVNPEKCTTNGKEDAFVKRYYQKFDETCTPVQQCDTCSTLLGSFTQQTTEQSICTNWKEDWATESQDCKE